MYNKYLIKNKQVLLKGEEEKKLIENHYSNLDNKLTELRKEMKIKQEMHEEYEKTKKRKGDI